MKYARTALLAALLIHLAACGGSGGGGIRPVLPETSPDADWTQGLSRPETPRGDDSQGFGSGARAQGNNVDALDPMTDLPSDGRDGLVVVRPEGAEVYINLEYAPGIEGRAEGPNWESDPAAVERLYTMGQFIEAAIWTGYKQWARHLDGTYVVDILVGYKGEERCGHSAVACYSPALDKVILGEDWLLENYVQLHIGQYLGIPGVEVDVFSELVFVATHEAAHQFEYRHPEGDTRGCGGYDGCHAPRGSGSVVGYDTLDGRRSRYAPSKRMLRISPEGGGTTSRPTSIWWRARGSPNRSWDTGTGWCTTSKSKE